MNIKVKALRDCFYSVSRKKGDIFDVERQYLPALKGLGHVEEVVDAPKKESIQAKDEVLNEAPTQRAGRRKKT